MFELINWLFRYVLRGFDLFVKFKIDLYFFNVFKPPKRCFFDLLVFIEKKMLVAEYENLFPF